MQDKDISHLIHDESFLNYCFGRNEEDVRYWRNWLAENPDCRRAVEELRGTVVVLAHNLKQSESDEQFSLLQERISEKETEISEKETGAETKRPSSFYAKLAFAASVMVVCAVGVLMYQSRRDGSPVTAAHLRLHGIKPGTDKAYLTLADGKKIALNDAGNGVIATQPGSVINKTAGAQLVYTDSETGKSTGAGATYNTIETPRGGQYRVRLPDGTGVWLNAASSLKYPVSFAAQGERRVELTGEAYFEVSKDRSRPFIVTSARQEVQVLGTHFNVKAYNDEETANTTLLEGSVLVKERASGQQQLLRPGQQSGISRDYPLIQVSEVNTIDAIAWKSGYFIFDNQDITTIMQVISRWYDVDVEYRDLNTDDRFGGTFSRSADLSGILKNLELLGKINFKINGRRVIVSDVH